MPNRILFLNLLVLLSTAFPVQAFRLSLVSAVQRRMRPDIGFALSVLMVAGLAIAASPIQSHFRLPFDPIWFAYAAGFGLLAPFLEYAVGLIAMRRLAPLRLHDRAGSGPLGTLAVLIAAIAEEMVFRGIFLPTLAWVTGSALTGVDIAVIVALAVTAIVYGLNHLYFGWLAVLQKTLTGVGFGLLYVLSGYSILTPIAAHALQNLVVQALPRRATPRQTIGRSQ